MFKRVFGMMAAFLATLMLIPTARAAVVVTITDERWGNNNTSRIAAAADNDAWISAVQAAEYTCFYQLSAITSTPGNFTDNSGLGNFSSITGQMGSSTVTISNRDMTNISNASDLGQLGGAVTIGSSLASSLQANSPMPDPDPSGDGGTHGWYRVNNGTAWEYWNENSGSSSSRNAVLFQFSPPVHAFGAFFGDVETRTDGNGTPALLRYQVTGGGVFTQTIPTTTADQTTCGASSTTDACGNRATRWIGVHGDAGETFDWVIVIVGDDNVGGNGYTEHISWVGATIAEAPGPGGCAGSGSPTAIRLQSMQALSPGGVPAALPIALSAGLGGWVVWQRRRRA
ncbi:MAG: hypothetical protein Fur0018_11900 [Anaerolineales bacterium]